MSATKTNPTRLHWNYFLALEKDLEAVSRYIEFCPENFNVFSIELAHLLLAAASEVDTLAKCVCEIVDATAKPQNIIGYQKVIKKAEQAEKSLFGKTLESSQTHRICDLRVNIPRFNIQLIPWANWRIDRVPDWWTSYNKVKHERNEHFKQATLRNAIYALGGLLAMNYEYCRFLMWQQATSSMSCRGKRVTRKLEPEPTFMRFDASFYDNIWSEVEDLKTDLELEISNLEDKIDEKRDK